LVHIFEYVSIHSLFALFGGCFAQKLNGFN
jgi:hypothetical protein